MGQDIARFPHVSVAMELIKPPCTKDAIPRERDPSISTVHPTP